jgi:hypothetical protein
MSSIIGPEGQLGMQGPGRHYTRFSTNTISPPPDKQSEKLQKSAISTHNWRSWAKALPGDEFGDLKPAIPFSADYS